MELHNKYTLTQHICLNQGVPDHYTSIIPRMGDLYIIDLDMGVLSLVKIKWSTGFGRDLIMVLVFEMALSSEELTLEMTQIEFWYV